MTQAHATRTTAIPRRYRVRKGVNQRAHSTRGVRPPDPPIARANLYVLRGDNAPQPTAEYRLCHFELF